MTVRRTVLRAYGRTVAFEVPAARTAEVFALLPPTYRPSDRKPERVFRGDEPGPLLSELELWVAEHARPYVFVHAGCVLWKGQAIVLPGRSMSGKSSLVAALVRAGATYYSDEYAVLDANGRVRPYARPLSIRPFDGGPARRVPVQDLGGRAGRGPARVGMVAALQHRGQDEVTLVSRAAAVLHLMDNVVPALSRSHAMLQATTAAVTRAVALSGHRDDAALTARALMQRLSDSSRSDVELGLAAAPARALHPL